MSKQQYDWEIKAGVCRIEGAKPPVIERVIRLVKPGGAVAVQVNGYNVFTFGDGARGVETVKLNNVTEFTNATGFATLADRVWLDKGSTRPAGAVSIQRCKHCGRDQC